VRLAQGPALGSREKLADGKFCLDPRISKTLVKTSCATLQHQSRCPVSRGHIRLNEEYRIW
jgi:hypothetical protein